MRRGVPAAVALATAATLAAGGCGSSGWSAVRSVATPAGEARLFVPRLYAPVVPGSIYPDRTRPIPARGRPAVVVVGSRGGALSRLGRDGLAPLAERGLVVVRPPAGPDPLAAARAAASALASEPETAGGRVGLLVEDASPEVARSAAADPAYAAVAFLAFRPAVSPGESARPPGAGRLLVANVAGPDGPSRETTGRLAAWLGAPAVEKWYLPVEGRLPSESVRDAVEWLAAALLRR